MAVSDTDKQAERIARRFYIDDKTRASFEEVSSRLGISETTWWNYTGSLKKAGMAKPVPSSTGSKKDDLELTEKGRAVVYGEVEAEATNARPTPSLSTTDKPLTPQDLQNLVDKYNQDNPSWRFELVPKGFRKEAHVE
jgi:hypothetical protein